MLDLQRNPQTLYAAVILAALVGVIVLARRQQGEPALPSPRTVPELARTPRKQFREPRPLVMPQRVSPISTALTGREVPAGFPEDESDDIGPIRQEEASIYGRADESLPSHYPSTERIAPLDAEAREPAPEPIELAKPKAATNPPRRPSSSDGAALLPVLQQAAQLNRRAESLAGRGAYYLARNMTIQSLRSMAEALDLQAGSGEHTAALASALAALREAEDFQSRSNEDTTVNVPLVVAGHRTPILRQANVEQISAISAQQQYLTFAQRQLVIAAGGQPVASHGLCILGKLQLRLQGSEPRQSDLARAMVYQQAALAVDRRNFPAANELGSILATFGQLQEARRVLQHSVGTAANPDGWHRLASVHEKLGEAELAAHALKQEEILTGGAKGPRPKIEWVEPEVFAGNAPAGSVKQAAGSTTQKTLPRTADSKPKQKETWISPFGFMR